MNQIIENDAVDEAMKRFAFQIVANLFTTVHRVLSATVIRNSFRLC